MNPPSESETAFLDAMASAATGVTVVASAGPAGKTGVTVSAFTSVSADPPLLLICINRKSAACGILSQNAAFSVNVLAENQRELADIFAGRGSVPRERGFAAAPWEDGDLGQPFLPAAAASFDCVLQSALDAGTHRIFIGRVTKARQGEAHAIAYSRRGYRRLTD